MIEYIDNKNQHDNPLVFNYVSNEFYDNFSDEYEQSDSDTELFDVEFFVQNTDNFNIAIKENNYKLIMESVKVLIRQLEKEKDINSDPDLGNEEIFNYLQFYHNCIRCLSLNYYDLPSKIMYTLGLLADISSSISDTLIINDTLKVIIDYFMKKIESASSDEIKIFFYFIRSVSLSSPSVRYLLIKSNILQFFSTILQYEKKLEIIISCLSCISFFFTYENFDDDSDIIELINALLSNLYQILNRVLYCPNDISFDDKSQILICSHILNIFSIYLKSDRFADGIVYECSNFLTLDIPYLFQNILEAELPKNIKNVITFPIVSIINHLLLFGDYGLAQNFAQSLKICLFIDLSQLETQGICAKCFSIIERLINMCPNNILILLQIEFYESILMMMDDADFEIKIQIVSIILETVINATSSEIVQFFVNEDVVNILIDFIDIPIYNKMLSIPDVLLKFNDLIPKDDPLSIEIMQVLDDVHYYYQSEIWN